MGWKLKNATIQKATITAADHGVLSVWLDLDFGGSGQGFGGYVNYSPKVPRFDTTGRFLWRIMEIAGVVSWDCVVGKSIRVQATPSKVHKIGHILKDDWFDPASSD